MKTYDLRDSEGRIYAFEVSNVLLGRRGVCRVVRSIPGAKLTRMPRLLSWCREEEFCAFTVDGETFVAWEPFGDNGRYWIGPKSARWCPQIEVVKAAFRRTRIPFALARG